ncbi:MAG: hypothetical protein KAU12_01475 [Candidatus Omnitrophica bacterium]|nr:hypothetical protein [Candidatus Omnitrophota bacterium]
MCLNEFFDREKILGLFKNLTDNRRLPPAFLFTGDSGRGKWEVLIDIAALIICESGRGPACDCSNCRRVKGGSHPDAVWFEPCGSPPSIKIEQIRELRRKIILKPYEAKKKVFIIFQAERMTEGAQNALLKTLEEPPEESILLLAVPNVRGLLDTITSRCRIIKFGAREDPAGELELREIIDAFLSLREERVEELFDCQNRERFLSVLKALLGFYRDVLFFKSGADKKLILNKERQSEIFNLSGFYTSDNLRGTIDFLNEMAKMANFNVSLRTCILNTAAGLKNVRGAEV